MVIILLLLFFNISLLSITWLVVAKHSYETSELADSLIAFFGVFVDTAFLLPHWLYASQYMKSSLIIPSLHSIESLMIKSRLSNEPEPGMCLMNTTEFIQ